MLKVDDYFSPAALELPLDALWQNLAEYYLCDEKPLVLQMQNYASISSWEMSKTTQLAANIIAKIRADQSQKNLAQSFLEEYNLSNQEGVMLLCLAESLLRIPDRSTLDSLLRERLSQINWTKHIKHSDSFLVNASTWGLLLTGRLAPEADQTMTVKQGVKHLISHLTEPIVRNALNRAIKLIAEQYIIGNTIEEALEASLTQTQPKQISTQMSFSFDLLTESALMAKQIQSAKQQYIQAIHHIAHHNRNHGLDNSISIKLSVLQTQFDYRYRKRATAELTTTLLPLLELAQALDVAVTIDAETSAQMELCLTVFANLFTRPTVRGWSKLGIAIQAYSKRSLASLCWLAALAKKQQTRIPIRLVKGAYWREDVRQSQLNDLTDYPVFTSQAATDISFLCCARWLLSSYVTPYLKAEFATHNPHTVAALEVMAKQQPIKLQKVYGMGEPLFSVYPQPKVSVLAACGPYHQLVPFILRRLLDFASQPGLQPNLQSPQIPLSKLIEHPVDKYAKFNSTCAPLGSDTPFSLNLASQVVLEQWQHKLEPYLNKAYRCGAIINGNNQHGEAHILTSNEVQQPQFKPNAKDETYTQVAISSAYDCQLAIQAAQQKESPWMQAPLNQRLATLSKLEPIFTTHAPALLALYLQATGQTIFSAEAELKQGMKLFKQILAQAESLFDQQEISLTDTTPYQWRRQACGVWLACPKPIHPFVSLLQQVTGALLCGNHVIIASPPEIAQLCAFLVKLFLNHGLPPVSLQLVISDPAWTLPLPSAYIAELNGISGELNQEQNRHLQALVQPLTKMPHLKINTSALNLMVLDSSVAIDRLIPTILSLAFGCAGQSSSSLKLICVQHEIAAELIHLLSNAMIELDIANRDMTQESIGPLVDASKVAIFNQYVAKLSQQASLLRQTPMEHDLNGHYVAPCLFQIDRLEQINADIEGPILHIYCYSNTATAELIDALNHLKVKGYCSIHSQHQTRLRQLEHGILGRHLIVNQSQSLPMSASFAMLSDELSLFSYSHLESQVCQNAGKYSTNP